MATFEYDQANWLSSTSDEADETKSSIIQGLEETLKERVYVDDPSEIPEGVTPQEGDQGGVYYDTAELDGEEGGDSEADGSAPSPDELIAEYGLEDMDGVENTLAAGILEGTDLDALAQAVAEEKSDRYINRVLQDVSERVGEEVDGYDSEAKLVYDWDDEFPDEAEANFRESVDDAAEEVVEESVGKWELDFFAENMAPLWQTAMEDTGNTNLLKDEEEVTGVDVSDDTKDAIRQHKEHVESHLREIYGDTIPVFRAFQGDAGRKLEEAGDAGEALEMERRALESYTTDLSYAKGYVRGMGPGAIVKDEVPVEDVWAASDTGFLGEGENELVVSHDEETAIESENILTPEKLDDGATNLKLLGEQVREMKND